MEDGNLLTRILFRPRALLLIVAAVVAITISPMLISLLPDLSRQKEYHLPTEEIVMTPPAGWVPKDLLQQVIERSELPQTVSILDSDVIRQIAEAFGQHPWVDEVVEVRKSMPGRIDVELKYRQSVAMVEVPGWMYPVTADGLLLPPKDFSGRDVKFFPIIQNVQSRPQGPAGTPWGDPALVGAARLASVLAPQWRKFDLVAIRISPRVEENRSSDDPIFELSTSGGSRIIWGRMPGSTYPGELSTQQKVGKLEKYLTDFGTFEKPNGPYEIDIRHWQETTRRPLSSRWIPSQRR